MSVFFVFHSPFCSKYPPTKDRVKRSSQHPPGLTARISFMEGSELRSTKVWIKCGSTNLQQSEKKKGFHDLFLLQDICKYLCFLLPNRYLVEAVFTTFPVFTLDYHILSPFHNLSNIKSSCCLFLKSQEQTS